MPSQSMNALAQAGVRYARACEDDANVMPTSCRTIGGSSSRTPLVAGRSKRHLRPTHRPERPNRPHPGQQRRRPRPYPTRPPNEVIRSDKSSLTSAALGVPCPAPSLHNEFRNLLTSYLPHHDHLLLRYVCEWHNALAPSPFLLPDLGLPLPEVVSSSPGTPRSSSSSLSPDLGLPLPEAASTSPCTTGSSSPPPICGGFSPTPVASGEGSRVAESGAGETADSPDIRVWLHRRRECLRQGWPPRTVQALSLIHI